MGLGISFLFLEEGCAHLRFSLEKVQRMTQKVTIPIEGTEFIEIPGERD